MFKKKQPVSVSVYQDNPVLKRVYPFTGQFLEMLDYGAPGDSVRFVLGQLGSVVAVCEFLDYIEFGVGFVECREHTPHNGHTTPVITTRGREFYEGIRVSLLSEDR